MIPCKPAVQRLIILFLSLFVFSIVNVSAQDGKTLFGSKCASCHNVFKIITGPKLGGVFEGDFYGGDIKKFLHWAYNTNSLVKSDPHYSELKATAGSIMTQFDASTLSEADAKAIFDYIAKT